MGIRGLEMATAAIFAMVTAGWTVAGQATADPIAVVVNPDSPVAEISTASLRAIYLGQATSLAGAPVLPVNYKSNTPIRTAFEKALMGMEPERVNEHWKSQKFLGFGDNQPVIYTSAEAVKKFVSRQKGGIGYLPLSQVDSTVFLVKKVNGHDIGGAGYPYQSP
ncbi:MAG: hypothetical protein HY815_03895 [Candidatus Riflebacteria bacterium]|nr:hypothetical protein [Candidatus Riflebacteria bacterium]